MSPWRILSLLLEYPDEELLGWAGELRGACLALPASTAREAIRSHLARRQGRRPSALQREYVETFDFAKRSTLYLSFHAYGDRRQRGMAMLHLKQAYREAGFALDERALPDHLPVILELTDLAPAVGVGVLQDFRPVLEVVRATLHEDESDYALLLDAVCALLPAASRKELEDARRIAATGPPAEEVGLKPFAPPEAMPVPCESGPETTEAVR